MLFSSLTFIFIFFPLILIIYFISKDKYKNYILLIASLIFYSWGEPKYIILMFLSIIVNYYLAILIDKSKKHSKKFFLISLIFNEKVKINKARILFNLFIKSLLIESLTYKNFLKIRNKWKKY